MEVKVGPMEKEISL